MQLQAGRFAIGELKDGERALLPHGGSVERRRFVDGKGGELTILAVDNGQLGITVLSERGMEIGEIRLGGELMSWNRDMKHLLHPDHVDLRERGGTGWLDGFYSAVASIGPELFGTPGEGYTLHGTSSYSPADPESVSVSFDEAGVTVTGRVVCMGFERERVFEKTVRTFSRWNSAVMLREETTVNLSGSDRTLDDGHHIQLCGPYLHEGGRYVLPTAKRHMLLRDSAPPEDDPLRIPALRDGKRPIRCYQYVPEPVAGLERIGEIASYLPSMDNEVGMTAEMIVNDAFDAAAFVIRPLDCFPRSLIAKEIGESFLFAFEPCRTRPNRMSQKHADGEAFVLAPGAASRTACLIGVTRDKAVIGDLEEVIVKRQ